MIQHLLKEVLDIFYPRCCPVCQKILKDQNRMICPDCEKNLQPIRPQDVIAVGNLWKVENTAGIAEATDIILSRGGGFLSTMTKCADPLRGINIMDAGNTAIFMREPCICMEKTRLRTGSRI